MGEEVLVHSCWNELPPALQEESEDCRLSIVALLPHAEYMSGCVFFRNSNSSCRAYVFRPSNGRRLVGRVLVRRPVSIHAKFIQNE